MGEPDTNLTSSMMLFGILLVTGVMGLVLLAFVLFMRWSRREEAENRRQVLK